MKTSFTAARMVRAAVRTVAGRHLFRRRTLARAGEAWRAVRVALLELELAGRVEYLADRIALCASANQTWAAWIFNRTNCSLGAVRLRLVGFLLRTLGFGGIVGANKCFAFRFRHREKIN